MKGLPIPSSLGGWVCAMVLLFFLFICYYLYLFPELHAFYFEEKPGYPAFYSASYSGTECQPLEIRVDSPRQIAPFGKRWIYIAIRNGSDSPITVTASLSVTPSLTGWYMPFLFGTSTSDTTALSFSPLQPHATAYGRIPLFSTEEITKAVLYIRGNCSVTITQPPTRNPRRYLAHAFTEQLLLPPWSNWILAAFGLLIPALVEPKEPTKLSLQLFGQVFGLSLGLSLAFIAGALVAVSAIWWPAEEGVDIVIIIVSIIMIILFIWKSLDLGRPHWLSQWLSKWLRGLSERLQRRNWLQFFRRFLVIPIISVILIIAGGLLCWLVSLLPQPFPLLKPLGGIFMAMGIVSGLMEFSGTILRSTHPQESGGRNESGGEMGSPADALRDKSES